MKYIARYRDDCGGDYECEIDADNEAEAMQRAESAAEEWCQSGAWGDDGATVTVWYSVMRDGVWTDEEWITVDIEPNHDALIRAAGGDTECEHDWTAEGEGGLDENPGVWSVGGTAMVFRTHCTKCGLRRRERYTGSQRNPGEHDTVEYQQPEK